MRRPGGSPLHALLPILATLFALAAPVAGGALPLVLASFQHDVTFGPTDELPVRHHVFYTFDVENPGAAVPSVSLQVRGFLFPGVPVSGTSTFKVGDVPPGATRFSFEASNLPYAYACATLVGANANTAPPISSEVCAGLRSAQGVVLP